MNTPHRQRLLIDTNLLLLLLIGSCHPSLIRKNKLTYNQGFEEEDFNQLRNFVREFQKLITTPHILAEVSNHADKIKEPDHLKFIQQFILLVEILQEEAKPSKHLVKTDAFVKYGLTDSAICDLANKNLTVLTIDFRLAGHLSKNGVEVINFNNYRRIPLHDWTTQNR